MTADRIAVCQNPDGDNEHIPLAPGEALNGCFECGCTPRIYVALDAVVKYLQAAHHSDGGDLATGGTFADQIQREFTPPDPTELVRRRMREQPPYDNG